MKRFNLSGWGAAALALPFAAWAANGPVVFDGRVAPGERVVVEGSLVTLGASVSLSPGSVLVVRASEGVVYSPGADFSNGTLDAHVGSTEGLSKPAGVAPAVEAFSASLRQVPGGFALRYALPKAGRAQVRLLDMQGKTLFKATLGARSAGRHEERLNLGARHRGLYLLRAEFEGRSIQQKVFLSGR